jgi:hypothetical protein
MPRAASHPIGLGHAGDGNSDRQRRVSGGQHVWCIDASTGAVAEQKESTRVFGLVDIGPGDASCRLDLQPHG